MLHMEVEGHLIMLLAAFKKKKAHNGFDYMVGLDDA